MNPDRLLPEAVLVHTVAEEDTARRWGNDLPVLATPVLLWLGEIASMRALDPALDPGEMSVGIGHDATHLAASKKGAVVEVRARLASWRGRRVTYDVEAREQGRLLLAGRHERAIVSRATFLAELGLSSHAPAGSGIL
jgi:predicted thioesterase